MSRSLSCFTPYCTLSAWWSETGHLLLWRSSDLYSQSLVPQGSMEQLGGSGPEMASYVTMPYSCSWQVFSVIIDSLLLGKYNLRILLNTICAVIRLGTQMKSIFHLCFRTKLVWCLLPPQFQTALCALVMLVLGLWRLCFCFASWVSIRLDGCYAAGGKTRGFLFPSYFLWLPAIFL